MFIFAAEKVLNVTGVTPKLNITPVPQLNGKSF